jgi:hypothetical protein
MPITLREALAYKEAKKLARREEHRRITILEGVCSGLTEKEFQQVVVTGKSSFKFKHTNNQYWSWREKKN